MSSDFAIKEVKRKFLEENPLGAKVYTNYIQPAANFTFEIGNRLKSGNVNPPDTSSAASSL